MMKLDEAVNVQKLEKLAKTKLKSGRMVISGVPVDVKDNGDYMTLRAVDRDALKDLKNILNKEQIKFAADKDGVEIQY